LPHRVKIKSKRAQFLGLLPLLVFDLGGLTYRESHKATRTVQPLAQRVVERVSKAESP